MSRCDEQQLSDALRCALLMPLRVPASCDCNAAAHLHADLAAEGTEFPRLPPHPEPPARTEPRPRQRSCPAACRGESWAVGFPCSACAAESATLLTSQEKVLPWGLTGDWERASEQHCAAAGDCWATLFERGLAEIGVRDRWQASRQEQPCRLDCLQATTAFSPFLPPHSHHKKYSPPLRVWCGGVHAGAEDTAS